MRIGLDAMGGDHAPATEVQGALEARALLDPGDKIVLVGQEPVILEQLKDATDWRETIEIRNAPQVIQMNDPPVEALRTKPNSSIAVLAEMHRDGEVDACISAGNTGAFVAAAQMRLRRLRGVHRPGIAIVTPTPRGPVVVCDVGANVACRPLHLYQYGVMASVYGSMVVGIENPRVAVLSVGQEEGKGNELVKRSSELLREDPNVNFVGNVEGRDVFNGFCDVIVCDGFVGNVALKLIEGMAQSLIRTMFTDIASRVPKIFSGTVKKLAKGVLDQFDFNQYGGAPLLGVGGICTITHGASDANGIMNAVRATKEHLQHRVNDYITERLAQGQRIVHG